MGPGCNAFGAELGDPSSREPPLGGGTLIWAPGTTGLGSSYCPKSWTRGAFGTGPPKLSRQAAAPLGSFPGTENLSAWKWIVLQTNGSPKGARPCKVFGVLFQSPRVFTVSFCFSTMSGPSAAVQDYEPLL